MPDGLEDRMLSQTQEDPRFWYAVPHGERYKDVSTAELERVHGELGKGPLGGKWKPPAYVIREGKNWVWPDWMSFTWPLLSTHAMGVLRDLIEPHCEFLPWISEDGHNYSLLNILTTIPATQWKCKKQTRWGDALISADIISVQAVQMPHMFVLEGYRGKRFVSYELARRSYDSGLKGVAFVDPRVPDMHLPFIRMRFGKKGTGFVRLRDDPAADSIQFEPN